MFEYTFKNPEFLKTITQMTTITVHYHFDYRFHKIPAKIRPKYCNITMTTFVSYSLNYGHVDRKDFAGTLSIFQTFQRQDILRDVQI